MANEQLPLLFFMPSPGADPLSVAESLLAGAPTASAAPLDLARTLDAIKSTHGFARLMADSPSFRLDNPRAEAALDGTATKTHITVRFYGNFEKLAQPLFKVLIAEGFACYSIWDRTLLTTWPKWEEPTIDKGFAGRMSRIMERKTRDLRETEPDPKRRAQLLDAFAKNPEFRAEMAKEARLEGSSSIGQKKTYSDHPNCYVRWRDGRPSAAELGALRKLDPKFAAMSMADLRSQIGDTPRLLLLTAASPRQAGELRASAEEYGLIFEAELP